MTEIADEYGTWRIERTGFIVNVKSPYTAVACDVTPSTARLLASILVAYAKEVERAQKK